MFVTLIFSLWRIRSCKLSVLITIHGLPLLRTSLHCYLLNLAISFSFCVSTSSNIRALGRFPDKNIINVCSLFQGCFSEIIKLSLTLSNCKEIFSLSTSSVFLLLHLLFGHSICQIKLNYLIGPTASSVITILNTFHYCLRRWKFLRSHSSNRILLLILVLLQRLEIMMGYNSWSKSNRFIFIL